MPKLSFPVEFVAEYRGREDARSFADRETGEMVNLGAVLKLERETVDGDAIAVPLRLRDDVAHDDALLATLKKGDKLRVSGEVVLYDSRPGYFKAGAVKKAS